MQLSQLLLPPPRIVRSVAKELKIVETVPLVSLKGLDQLRLHRRESWGLTNSSKICKHLFTETGCDFCSRRAIDTSTHTLMPTWYVHMPSTLWPSMASPSAKTKCELLVLEVDKHVSWRETS
jgi:hypothetical protein